MANGAICYLFTTFFIYNLGVYSCGGHQLMADVLMCCRCHGVQMLVVSFLVLGSWSLWLWGV